MAGVEFVTDNVHFRLIVEPSSDETLEYSQLLLLYLITLEIPPFPLMSSNVTYKLVYLLSINVKL